MTKRRKYLISKLNNVILTCLKIDQTATLRQFQTNPLPTISKELSHQLTDHDLDMGTDIIAKTQPTQNLYNYIKHLMYRIVFIVVILTEHQK